MSEFICRLIDDLDAGRIRKDACKAAIYAIVRQTRESAEKGVPVQTYGHYFRDVSHLQAIDVYRVLLLFGVTDPCLQHATKKLLVAGGRGHKDAAKDVAEAIVSLQRWQAMRAEDEA